METVWSFVGLVTIAGSGMALGASKQPNIVLILADDMGYCDLGCFGSEIATPNLDRLASGGLRFTSFYNNARCCPTRASVLTGLYPQQAGVGHMTDNRGTPAYLGHLGEHCVTIAEVLRAAGYGVYMAGKWHVGNGRPHWPIDRGFDRYLGVITGACNYFLPNPPCQMARGNEPFTPDDPQFYMTDAFTDAGIEFIRQHTSTTPGKPFFLYLAYTSPHWPLHAWPQDIAKYRGKYMDGWDELRERRHRRMTDMGIVDRNWPLPPPDDRVPAWKDVKDKADRDLAMAVYAAQIDRMDQNIGRVLDVLRETGAQDNTLVMFLSDNGGSAEAVNRGKPDAPAGDRESFLSYGVPWASASNTPFRLYKHWVHEGGIATPFIAWWPSVIRNGGQLTPQMGHVMDLMATCIDVAGAPYPATHKGQPITPLEGKSLLPVFQGRTRTGHDVLCWEHEGHRAIRRGKWKLVEIKGGSWELYDMETDRTEVNNLAGRYSNRVREMAGLYEQWAQRVGVIAQKRR